MEGVGSRLGRASSRYGLPTTTTTAAAAATTTTVFTGPVRKWKKRWVHVSSSSSYRNNNSSNNKSSTRPNTKNGNGGNGNGNGSGSGSKASALLLCRWTPISPSDSDNNSVIPDEPPRRKFRYTPIVALEQKKEAAEKVDDKAETSMAHSLTIGTTTKSNDAYEKPNTEGAFLEEIQAANKNLLARQHSNTSHLNLDLGFKSHNENHESDGGSKEVELGRPRSGWFRT
ncbi:hypothetical protein CsSME_00026118 [Camellia sinensis var. sinensis]